jgi:hypothetical protein
MIATEIAVRKYTEFTTAYAMRMLPVNILNDRLTTSQTLALQTTATGTNTTPWS